MDKGYILLGNHEISIKKSLTSGKLARIKTSVNLGKYNYDRFVYKPLKLGHFILHLPNEIRHNDTCIL